MKWTVVLICFSCFWGCASGPTVYIKHEMDPQYTFKQAPICVILPDASISDKKLGYQIEAILRQNGIDLVSVYDVGVWKYALGFKEMDYDGSYASITHVPSYGVTSGKIGNETYTEKTYSSQAIPTTTFYHYKKFLFNLYSTEQVSDPNKTPRVI